MPERLEGRVAVVTGAGSGIGAATAARLAEEGAAVVVTDLDGERAAATAAAIAERGGVASAHQHDVSQRESWRGVLDAVVAEHGGLHGLVNNAGITRDKTLLRMSDEDWQQVLAVHLTGTWLGCQLAVPHLKQGGGAIVNMSSTSRAGAFGQANYASAKAGIVALTATVAFEHARHGIRCNAIAPGPIRTPMTEAVDPEIRESWMVNVALGRLGEAEEVAAVVAFLLSDDASYVTAQTIAVDGGVHV